MAEFAISMLNCDVLEVQPLPRVGLFVYCLFLIVHDLS